MSKIIIDLDRIRTENGTYSEADFTAIQRMTGKTIAELEEESYVVKLDDEPIRKKSDVKTAEMRAKLFAKWREAGKQPLSEWNNLPD